MCPGVVLLSPTGLFEVRAAEYLASCPEPEPSGVNKFLKGLGKPLAPPLPKKGIICILRFFAVTVCCAFREQNEVLTEEVRDCLSRRREGEAKPSVACQARRSARRISCESLLRTFASERKPDRLGGDEVEPGPGPVSPRLRDKKKKSGVLLFLF